MPATAMRRCALCRTPAPQATLTRLHWRGRWRLSGRQRRGRGRYLCADCQGALRAGERKPLGLLTRHFGAHADQVLALLQPRRAPTPPPSHPTHQEDSNV